MLSNGVPEAVPGAAAGLHRDEWLAQFNQIWKECAHE